MIDRISYHVARCIQNRRFSTQAFPSNYSELIPIADTAIGFELESNNFRFKATDDITDQPPNPKAKPLHVYRVVDGNLQRRPDLELTDRLRQATAEIGDSTTLMRTDFIFGGSTGAPIDRANDMSKHVGYQVCEVEERGRLLSDSSSSRRSSRQAPSCILKVYQASTVGSRFSRSPVDVSMTAGVPLAGLALILENPAYEARLFVDKKLNVNIEQLKGEVAKWLEQEGDKEIWRLRGSVT